MRFPSHCRYSLPWEEIFFLSYCSFLWLISGNNQTAERDNEPVELEGKAGAPQLEAQKSSSSDEMGRVTSSDGR